MNDNAITTDENALPDQHLILLDNPQFEAFVACLDAPVAPYPALRKLLTTKAPWEG
jgi:uncharacterized protein (DUF1778 family)